jgi:hypothetical protein
MAHIEIQITSDALLSALRELLLGRLLADCYVIPVPGLVVDRVTLGSLGPITCTQGKLSIRAHVGVALVTTEDVIAAKGAALNQSTLVELTGTIGVIVSGATLIATFEGLDHDANYRSLLRMVALQVGDSQAQAMFTTWENEVQTNIGLVPLLEYNFGLSLPQEFSRLPFGRSALSADPTRIAIRFEVGPSSSDGDWTSFLEGSLEEHLQGAGWGIFIDSATVLRIATTTMTAALSSAGGALGSPVWVPQGLTAAVESYASVTTHVHREVFGVTVFDSDVTIGFHIRTAFTMESLLYRNAANVLQGVMRTDISYRDVKIEGGFAADVANALDVLAFVDQSIKVPPGYTKVAENAFFQDSPIPSSVLADVLILRATKLVGLAEGMSITGVADAAAGSQVPSCQVEATPFALEHVLDCQALANKTQREPTPNNVSATASLTVSTAPAIRGLPLVVGAFQLVPVGPNDPPDPDQQFSPCLPGTPQRVTSSATFQLSVTASSLSSGYKNNPYPCQLIILTNGGARYVSLGEIPIPQLDPVTGFVTNMHGVYKNDCVFVDFDPWVLVFAVFNLHWLVDPMADTRVKRAEELGHTLGRLLLSLEDGQSSPVVIDDVQVGAVSVGTLDATSVADADRLGRPAAARLFMNAARLQPPARLD